MFIWPQTHLYGQKGNYKCKRNHTTCIITMVFFLFIYFFKTFCINIHNGFTLCKISLWSPKILNMKSISLNCVVSFTIKFALLMTRSNKFTTNIVIYLFCKGKWKIIHRVDVTICIMTQRKKDLMKVYQIIVSCTQTYHKI